MALTPLALIFFGGLLLIFLTGRLIGHIIGLDKYAFDDKTPDTSATGKIHHKKNRKIKNKQEVHPDESQAVGKYHPSGAGI